MANWKDEEVFQLVDCWGDDVIQSQLEGCKRNKQVYEKISKAMQAKGYSRDAVQCREKVKKLKGEYRKIKDKHNKTGTGRKKWKFFDVLDSALGNKPATKPPLLIDTLADGESEQLQREEDECSVQEITEAGYSSSSSVDTPRKMDETKGTIAPSEVKDESKEGLGIDVKSKQDLKPSKKRGRDDRMEKIMSGIVDKVMKSQEESDRKFLALEEKRIRLEEHQMEREERMKREEREFQLRMMSMLMGGSRPTPQCGSASSYPSYLSQFGHTFYSDSSYGNQDFEGTED